MTEYNEEVVEKYVRYVSEMVEKFKKLGDLVSKDTDTVTPEKLNSALALYYNISLALNSEYQRQKMTYLAMKQDFDSWCDSIFEEAKRSVIAEYEESKIKPSVKEFETRARNTNRREYNEKEMDLNEQEAKMRFLLRMQETVKGYDSILVTLASNMRQEMRSLSLDSRMNDNKIRDGIGFPERKSRVPVDEN